MKINLFKFFILIFIIFSCSSEADVNDSNTGGNGNSGNGGDNDNDSGGGSGGDNNDDQTNFYLSSIGSDSNNGTKDNPWKSLSKLSSKQLSPGDSIFFKKGESFYGHLVVNGSGSADKPIVFTSYGSGNQPIISGSVGIGGGGDYQEAIYILNNDNMVFDDLEIQNNRLSSRSNVDDSDSFGIYVHNTGDEVMNNFVFRNMTFKNVYAISQVDPSNQQAFNLSLIHI